MASHFDPAGPHVLTPDQRLDEVAAILALGIQRLFALRVEVIESHSGASNSSRNCLDVSAEQSVTVPRG